MSKTSQRKRSIYEMGRDDAKRLCGPRWKRHPMKGLYMKGFLRERKKMQRKDGFDWVPEQQRQIRRQKIRDHVIAAVVALLIVSVCLIGG